MVVQLSSISGSSSEDNEDEENTGIKTSTSRHQQQTVPPQVVFTAKGAVL